MPFFPDDISIPCGNMVERDEPECSAGRKFPEDCHKKCLHYQAGLTDQERRRAVAWAIVQQVSE